MDKTIASNMRVLLTWQSDALGGVERRMLEEARVLLSLGWEVFVAVPHFAHDDIWRDALQQMGVRFLEWNPYKFVERQHLVWPFPQLAGLSGRQLIAQGFDFAVLPLTWTTVGMSRLYALQTADIPCVLSFRCTYPQAQISRRMRGYLHRALDGVVGGYGVSAPATDSFRANFGDILNGQRFATIHNGVDTQVFAPDTACRARQRTALGIGDEECVVMFCARLDPMKRPAIALRAFAHAHAHHPSTRLIVVGEGHERAELETLARTLGVHRSVIFAGFQTDVLPWYLAADLYIATSAPNEGFNSAACEALACGIPTLLPDDGIHRGLFGSCQAVHLCPGDDAERWGQELAELIAGYPASAEDHRKAARAFAEDELDVNRMRRELSAFYRDIAHSLAARKRQENTGDIAGTALGILPHRH